LRKSQKSTENSISNSRISLRRTWGNPTTKNLYGIASGTCKEPASERWQDSRHPILEHRRISNEVGGLYILERKINTVWKGWEEEEIWKEERRVPAPPAESTLWIVAAEHEMQLEQKE